MTVDLDRRHRPADDVVGELRSGRHLVRASVSTWRGKTLVSLRHWVPAGPGGQLVPTARGVTLLAQELGEFERLVRTIRARLDGLA